MPPRRKKIGFHKEYIGNGAQIEAVYVDGKKQGQCKINYAELIEEKGLIIFKINANRFLRNMVRAIVGTLIEVGRKRISLKNFEKIIIEKNRSNAGFSAPAHGLFLTDIDYDWNKIK